MLGFVGKTTYDFYFRCILFEILLFVGKARHRKVNFRPVIRIQHFITERRLSLTKDAFPSVTMRRACVAWIVRATRFVILNVPFNWINVSNPALVSCNVQVVVLTVQIKSAHVPIPILIPTMFPVPPGSSQSI